MVFFARHTATAFDRKLEWRYIFCTAAAPLASGTLKGSRSGFGFGPDLVLAHFLQLTSGKWPLLPTHFYKVRGTLKKSDFVPTRGWGVWPNPNFLKPQPYMAQLLCWNTANIYDLLKCFFFLLKNLCSFQFSVFITIIHLCKYVWQQRKSLTNCFHGKIPFTKIWMRLPCSSWKFFLLLQGKKMSPWKQQVLVLELLCSL